MTNHAGVIAGGGPTGLMLAGELALSDVMLRAVLIEQDVRQGDEPTLDDLRGVLHDGRPVLLNLSESGLADIGPWADRVQCAHVRYAGPWSLPGRGAENRPMTAIVPRLPADKR